jgi:hypothetical protein
MIPKRFSLVNREWLVRMVTTKQLQRHLDKHPCEGQEDAASGMMGLCDPAVNRIFINKDLCANDVDILHTYCHEMVHAVKYANGETDHDEAEVDRLGGYMAQVLQTMQGDAWKSKS